MAHLLLSGDPERFLVDRLILRSISRDDALWWPAPALRDSAKLGDFVFLLRTEIDDPEPIAGGIIACARVVTPGTQRECPHPDLWRTPMRGLEWYVGLELEEARLSPEAGMVGRDAMRKAAPLAKMGLNRAGVAIETRLNHEQTEALRQLWRRAAVQTPR